MCIRDRGGTFSINKNLQVGSNCVLYATVGFNIAKDADISIGIGNCALITPGDIVVSKDLTMSGLMFASGTITTKKVATITGSLVAGQGFNIAKEANLTYNASMLPTSVLPGFTPEITLKNIFWRE